MANSQPIGIVAPRIEMTGRTFGRLTVVSYAGNGKWNCECSCGIVKAISGCGLRNGTTQSCGCLQVELLRLRSIGPREPRIDLSGKKFGLLTVIDYAGNSRWNCCCECGNSTVVEAGNLKTNTRSCGCLHRLLVRENNRRKFKDITGQVFGRLTVLAPRKVGRKYRWLCRCECGNETIVQRGALLGGTTASCGCLATEMLIARSSTHCMTRTPEHRTWAGMKSRCYNQHTHSFSDYGGRGITVCNRWRESFEAFYADMGPRPSPRHSLDRIDNDGNYEPGNCRWATRSEQQTNKRNNHRLELNGECLTIADWSRKLGFPKWLIRQRIVKQGWSVEAALLTPHSRRRFRLGRSSE